MKNRGPGVPTPAPGAVPRLAQIWALNPVLENNWSQERVYLGDRTDCRHIRWEAMIVITVPAISQTEMTIRCPLMP